MPRVGEGCDTTHSYKLQATTRRNAIPCCQAVPANLTVAPKPFVEQTESPTRPPAPTPMTALQAIQLVERIPQ